MARKNATRNAMPEHVGHKLHTIAELFAEADRRAGKHQLAIERLTDLFGQPLAAYAFVVTTAVWIAGNALAPSLGARAVDPPPFEWLQCATCVAALLMTVAILTKQNRGARLAQQRAQLDLQVNLIAEEKIAKIVSLLEELRRDLPSVKDRKDPLAEQMAAAVDLHAVADKMDAFQGDERAHMTTTPPPPPQSAQGFSVRKSPLG